MTRYLMHPMTTDPRVFGFNTEDATPPSHGARTEPNSTLLPHQQRVVAEHAECVDRLRKLQAFIANTDGPFQNLCDEERRRLVRQEDVMNELGIVLAERVAAFTQGARCIGCEVHTKLAAN